MASTSELALPGQYHFPLGACVTSTHSKWNHSYGQCGLGPEPTMAAEGTKNFKDSGGPMECGPSTCGIKLKPSQEGVSVAVRG